MKEWKTFHKAEDGRIYQFRPDRSDYYLKFPKKSPDEDPRIPADSFRGTKMKTEDARKEINDVWRMTEQSWEHGGKHYSSVNASDVKLTDVPKHHDKYGFEYAVVLYHGKVHWMCCNTKYFPRFEICRFEGIDKEPKTVEFDSETGSFRQFTQWTDITNLKFVFCKEDNKFI